jgi:hypothetical protein
MIWYFLAHAALLWGLFMWLDGRQTERYNKFAEWSQNFSAMLGEDIQRIQRSVEELEAYKRKEHTQLELPPHWSAGE